VTHGASLGSRAREGHALLEGQVVLVTGASSGIGEAIALAAAREGADVVLTYREHELGARRVADAIGALGRRAATFALDLARDESIAELTRNAQASFGRIDAWINNAGADILTGRGADRSTLEKLDLLLAVDLRGTILASWAAAELMHAQDAGGVIVNVSWDYALSGMPGRAPELFAAVKGGILSFSKSLARSVAPRVRVNVLAPGWIATAFADTLDEQRRREIGAGIPLGRWGTPDDVARAAIWLASPEARFHTGQVLLVNGGDVM
jgi:3-oxoacyl-[acyl-carrier protein] reductase